MEDEYLGTKLEPSEFHVILGAHNVRNGCVLQWCVFIDDIHSIKKYINYIQIVVLTLFPLSNFIVIDK